MHRRSAQQQLARTRIWNILGCFSIIMIFYYLHIGRRKKEERAKRRALSAEPGTKPAKKRKRSLDLNTAEDTDYVPQAA